MRETIKKNKLIKSLVIVLLIMGILTLSIIIHNAIKTYNANKGITSIIPTVLSLRSMDALNALSESDEIKKYYDLIERGNADYQAKYAILNSEDIYLLKSAIDNKKLEKLLLKVEALYFLLNQSTELKRRGFKPDATVINYYLGLAENNEIKDIYASVNNMTDQELKEYAIKFVINEYNDLRINMEDLKGDYLNKNIIICLIMSIIKLCL